jgi:nicotinamidase-related amidase
MEGNTMKLNSAETAVLVCHLQKDIIENQQALGALLAAEATRRNVVGAANRLLKAADAGAALPVLVRIAWRADRSNMLVNIPLTQGAAEMNALIDGLPGADFVADLARVPGEVVVTHHNPNPFRGNDLQEILQRRAIKTLVVCGVATNMAVISTAFAAADLGYRIIVVEDACSAQSEETHLFALETLGMLGEIVDIDDVITALS